MSSLSRFPWAAIVVLTLLATVAADDKEVRLPKLPQRAGKIDKNASKTFTATKSGLKYRILRQGDGPSPTAADTVEVYYHGWLDNGKVFDSSYHRNESAVLPLKTVIAGWNEGIQLVKKGGMIELEVPSTLGYGDAGSGNEIPPKARLHFVIELVDIK